VILLGDIPGSEQNYTLAVVLDYSRTNGAVDGDQTTRKYA
jgi:hypothetical protein